MGKFFYGKNGSNRTPKKIFYGKNDENKQVKKIYYGKNGENHLIYTLDYILKIDDTYLGGSYHGFGAASNNDYALFAGGRNDWKDDFDNVIAFDKTLTRSILTGLSIGRSNTSGVSMNKYIMFAGGSVRYSTNAVDVYDTSTLVRYNPQPLDNDNYDLPTSSTNDHILIANRTDGKIAVEVYDGYLTKLSNTIPIDSNKGSICSASFNNYAMFAGGYNSSGDMENIIDIYNNNLTKRDSIFLSVSRSSMGSATIYNYVLFGGGDTIGDYFMDTNAVDAYDINLVRINVIPLNESKSHVSSTSLANRYALFGGGGYNEPKYDIECYNSNLTKHNLDPLTDDRDNASGIIPATNIGNYALFPAGYDYSTTSVEVYQYFPLDEPTIDYPIKKNNSKYLYLSEEKDNFATSSVGNYALIAGGERQDDYDYSSVVDTIDISLTMGIATQLNTARELYTGIQFYDNALFIGGYNFVHGNSNHYSNEIDCYKNNLTKYNVLSTMSINRRSPDAVVNGDYLMIAGSYIYNEYMNQSMDIYNVSLTRITSNIVFDELVTNMGSISINNYAIFTGDNRPLYEDLVNVYDSSLTKINSTLQPISVNSNIKSVNVGNYSLSSIGNSAEIFVIDANLVVQNYLQLSGDYRDGATPASLGGRYALFGSGVGEQSNWIGKEVDSFDFNLTRTTLESLWMGNDYFGGVESVSVGNFAMFIAKYKFSYSNRNIIEVYEYIPTEDPSIIGPISKLPNIEPLDYAAYGITSANNNKYALFAGGLKNTEIGVEVTASNIVTAYNISLNKSIVANLSADKYDMASSSFNDNILFGGGNIYSEHTKTDVIDIYDTSLTKITSTLSEARSEFASSSNSKHVLFGGGTNNTFSSSENMSNVVDAYDINFTRTTPTQLSTSVRFLSSATVQEYILFAGGYTQNITLESNVVNYYNSGLSKGNAANLGGVGKYGMASVSINNYALFAGGRGDISSNSIELYNENLTKSTINIGFLDKSNIGATSIINEYAIFAGGNNDGTYYNSVYYIDSNLTNNEIESLELPKIIRTATSIREYALFYGYDNTETVDNKGIEVYKYIGPIPYPDPEPPIIKVEDIEFLSAARQTLTATSIDNYALFGGGAMGRGVVVNMVDTYDTSLVKGTATVLSNSVGALSSTAVNNHALFGGGGNYIDQTNYVRTNSVDMYDSTLTKTILTPLRENKNNLAATSVGNYALFGGGNIGIQIYSNQVDAYDDSFTRITPTELRIGVDSLTATSIGNYALFAGGYNTLNGGNYTDAVTVYDSSLTRTNNADDLSIARDDLVATSIDNYALFGGGYDGENYSDVVDVYNTSLVKMNSYKLSVARNNLVATSIDNYALFAGGNSYGNGSSTYYNIIDIFNSSLIKINPYELSVARNSLAATSINNYAIFGGGYQFVNYSYSLTDTVDAYTIK